VPIADQWSFFEQKAVAIIDLSTQGMARAKKFVRGMACGDLVRINNNLSLFFIYLFETIS
jgi:hypothetical protein